MVVPDSKYMFIVSNINLHVPEHVPEVVRHGLLHRKVKGHYTSVELEFAIGIGCTITSLDGKDNFPHVFWTKENACIQSSAFFKKSIDQLFAVKMRPNTPEGKAYAKYIMNRIWGSLCAREKMKPMSIGQMKTNYMLIDGKCTKVLEMNSESLQTQKLVTNKMLGGQNMNVVEQIFRPVRKYSSLLPRIKPFLLATGKVKMMMKAMSSIRGEIVRVHTDCFWTTEKQEEITGGKTRYGLGYLGFEKEEYVDIDAFLAQCYSRSIL